VKELVSHHDLAKIRLKKKACHWEKRKQGGSQQTAQKVSKKGLILTGEKGAKSRKRKPGLVEEREEGRRNLSKRKEEERKTLLIGKRESPS